MDTPTQKRSKKRNLQYPTPYLIAGLARWLSSIFGWSSLDTPTPINQTVSKEFPRLSAWLCLRGDKVLSKVDGVERLALEDLPSPSPRHSAQRASWFICGVISSHIAIWSSSIHFHCSMLKALWNGDGLVSARLGFELNMKPWWPAPSFHVSKQTVFHTQPKKSHFNIPRCLFLNNYALMTRKMVN